MQASIVLAQVRRTQDSVQLLVEGGLDDVEGQFAAEAQEALLRAETCIAAVLEAQAAGLGQRLGQLPSLR
ncbi:hypothetical protein [Vulcanococcus limneticus]|uniref:hypothetical protein n=1 Tax=Vulcanococcus limneticus TaxID=2170428 RepID=UPI00398BF28D